jgi:hypothetical protein
MTGARIWFISNLGKYVPGKVWQIIQMGLMSTEQGIDPVSSTAAAIVNAGVNVAMGLAVGVVAGSSLFDRILEPYHLVWLGRPVAVLAMAGVILLPILLPWAFRVANQRLGIAAPIDGTPTRAIVVASLANVMAWALYGAAFQCLIHGLLGNAPASYEQYTGAFAISYVIGYIILIAPGGLGIREVALTVALTAGGMSTAVEASAITVASRIWLVVIDVLPALLFLAYRPRPTDENDPDAR